MKKRRRPKSLMRRKLKDSLRFLPIVLPVILSAFIYAWLHTRVNIIGLTVKNLRAEKGDLVKQNESIRLRIEELQAPRRIEKIARDKLGMVSFQSGQVVSLDGPVRPPAAFVEPDPAIQETLPSGAQSNGLFGFLKKREHIGSTSREDMPKRAAPQSG